VIGRYPGGSTSGSRYRRIVDYGRNRAGCTGTVERTHSAGTRRETRNLPTDLALRQGKVELFPDTIENIALDNAACIAGIDGGPQRRADDFAGVLVVHLRHHKPVELGTQQFRRFPVILFRSIRDGKPNLITAGTCGRSCRSRAEPGRPSGP